MTGIKEYIGNFKFQLEGIRKDIEAINDRAEENWGSCYKLSQKLLALLEYNDLEMVKKEDNMYGTGSKYRVQKKYYPGITRK